MTDHKTNRIAADITCGFPAATGFSHKRAPGWKSGQMMSKSRIAVLACVALVALAAPAQAQVATLIDGAPTDTPLNANNTASGTLTNIGTGSGPGGWNTAQFDFSYSVSGSATWSGGIQFQSPGGLEQIWTQPLNTTFDSSAGNYTIDFTRGVAGLSFFHGGLDNDDTVRIRAFYMGNPVALPNGYFSDFTGNVSIQSTDGTAVVLDGPGNGNGNERANEYHVTFPDTVLVDQLVFNVGKSASSGSSSTVTLAHYLFDWLPFTINAEDDAGPTVSNSSNAPNILNVLTDNDNGVDTLDDPNTAGLDPATTANVTVAPTGALPAGITLDAAGNISVAAGTAPNTYTIPYQICEIQNPTNCATAAATFVVTAPAAISPVGAGNVAGLCTANGNANISALVFSGGAATVSSGLITSSITSTLFTTDGQTNRIDGANPAFTLFGGVATDSSINLNDTAISGLDDTYTQTFADLGGRVLEVYQHVNSLDQLGYVFDPAANPGMGWEVLSANGQSGNFGASSSGASSTAELFLVDVGEADQDLTGADEVSNTDLLSADATIRLYRLDGGPISSITWGLRQDPASANIGDGFQTLQQVCVVPKSIAVEKTSAVDITGGTDPLLLDAGDTITYTYVVQNTGDLALTDVGVTETSGSFTGTGPLPVPGSEVLTTATTSSDAGVDGGIDVLGPNDVATFTATYSITADDIAARTVTNQALASGADPFGAPVTDVSDDPTDPTDALDNGDPADPTVTDFGVPPVAVNNLITSPAIAPVSVNPLTNDTDADGTLVPATVVLTGTGAPAGSVLSPDGKTLTVPGEGVWTVNATTGALSFTPNPALIGDPTPAAYTVADNDGNTSNEATVSVDYGTPPVANDDPIISATVAAVSVNPLANDTDADGTLVATSVVLTATGAPAGSVLAANGKTLTVPGEGVWTVNTTTGEVTFTPSPTLVGDPTPAAYTVNDNAGNLSNEALVSVDFGEPPVAGDDAVVSGAIGPVTLDPLINDTDADGTINPTTVVFTGTVPPSGAVLSPDGKTLTVPGEGIWMINPTTGAISFDLDPALVGDPTPVAYTVDDNDGNTSAPATVTLQFGEPPVAGNDGIFSAAIAPASVNPLLNDTDADGTLDATSVVLTLTGTPAGAVLSPDGKTLTVPGEGVWTVNPTTGLITFSPDPALVGDPTPANYIVADNDGNPSNEATVTVGYGERPVAINDSASDLALGTPVTLNILSNDGDPDGTLDPTSVMLTATGAPAGAVLSPNGKTLTVPGQGVWTVNATTGAITFTPATGYQGDPTPAAYTVADNVGNVSEEALVTLNFQDPPVAANDVLVSAAIAPATLNPLTNDSDFDGVLDPTSVVLTGAGSPPGSVVSAGGKTLTVPGQGIWTVNSTTGEITFSPDLALVGDPTPATYTVADDDGNTSNPATVTVNFGDRPVALDDGVVSALIAPVTLTPVGNDTDADGTIDPTSVVLTTTGAPAGSVLSPNGKTLTVPGEGVWSVDLVTGVTTFTPDVALIGDPSPVIYVVSDNDGNVSNPATLNVGYGDRPLAVNDTANDLPLGVPATINPLANDLDADGTLDGTSVVLTLTGAPAGSLLTPDGKTLTVPGEGVWTVNTTTGAVTFTPDTGYEGNPTPVAYTVADNVGNVSDEATVTLTFQQRPVATADAAVSPTIAPVTLDPLTNDSDADGTLDPTTVVLTDGPVGSTLSPDGKTLTIPGEGIWTVDPVSGAITFSPDPALVGTPTPVAYTVDDNDGNTSNSAGLSVVYGVPPVAQDDIAGNGIYGQPIAISPLLNDSDADGTLNPRSVSFTDPAATDTNNDGFADTLVVANEGVWTINPATGEVTFTPDSELVGDPTPVAYTVQDNDGNPSNPATLTVSYEPPTQALVVLKTVDASGVSDPAEAGELVRWTITVENTGNVALAGVTPVDTLTDANGVALTLTQDVTKLSESIADDDILLIGEIATYEVTYALEQSAIDSGALSNTAVASGQPVTPDGTPIVTGSGFLSTSDDPDDNTDVDSDGDGNPDDPTVLSLSGFDEEALTITKTAATDIVIAGAAVPYTLTVTNSGAGLAAGLGVRDVLPSDLSYVMDSATVDGVPVDVTVSGQTITFPDIDVPGNAEVVIGLVARVGPFASGDLVNSAQMFDPVTGSNIGEAATATVQVRPEAVFQCSDIIGKVYDDVNQNGYQDGPFTPDTAAITDQRYLGDKFARPAPASEIVEPGLPGVRLATTDGTVITTDDYGRFSVPCAALPPRIGENFTLKIDVNSLPTGYRMTTENPRTMRVTAGIMTEMNFGAAIGRVIDIDLTATAFTGADQPDDQLVQGLDGLLGQVAASPATLRITYFTNGEGGDVARARLDVLEDMIRGKWRDIGNGRLSIERTVARLQ